MVEKLIGQCKCEKHGETWPLGSGDGGCMQCAMEAMTENNERAEHTPKVGDFYTHSGSGFPAMFLFEFQGNVHFFDFGKARTQEWDARVFNLEYSYKSNALKCVEACESLGDNPKEHIDELQRQAREMTAEITAVAVALGMNDDPIDDIVERIKDLLETERQAKEETSFFYRSSFENAQRHARKIEAERDELQRKLNLFQQRHDSQMECVKTYLHPGFNSHFADAAAILYHKREDAVQRHAALVGEMRDLAEWALKPEQDDLTTGVLSDNIEAILDNHKPPETPGAEVSDDELNTKAFEEREMNGGTHNGNQS